MERAVNPQTGEVLFLVGNQWVPPAQTAKNDKGDTAYLINNRWEIVPGSQAVPDGLASLAKPEPILSPEEQMMGAIGAASAPQERLPRPPEGQFELRPYEPSLTDQLMELLPGNKYKAANEYAARQIAKERGVPVGEIYKDIGGARPMFNPEGRAPIRAGVEAAKITAQELPKVPEATLSTFLKAYRAGDIEAPADAGMVDKAIAAMKPTDAKGKPDPNYDSFLGLGESLGFSVATMVASLTAAAAGEVVAGPVGGVSAGMAASGAMAYRASKDDFLSRVRDKLNGESQKLYGTNISPEDWNKAKQEYNRAAVEYGAWEAIPEAVSNAVFIKAFASPVKTGRGAAKMNSLIEKVGSQGVEQATETMTALGQNAAEMKAGLSDEEMTIADAFRQQFIQTLLIGGTMAGGFKAKEVGDKFYREVVEPRVRPGSALAKAIQADVDAVAFNPESTRRTAVEALNPNRAKEQVVAEPGIASLIQKQQIAMPPPPEEPEEEILAAPPSKSQDMDAMLREALGEPAPTIPAGIVKTAELDEAQVKGMTDEQLGAQVNNINLRDKEYELVKAEFDKRKKEADFLAEMQDLQDDVSDRDDKYVETPAAKVKPAETVFTAPAGFAYSVTQSPAYGGADPLSAEDAEFELDTLLENAKRGRLTPQRFAESEIGRRLDTVQVMAINDGIRNNPVATIEALIQKVAPAKTPPKLEALKAAPTVDSKLDELVEAANKLADLSPFGKTLTKEQLSKLANDSAAKNKKPVLQVIQENIDDANRKLAKFTKTPEAKEPQTKDVTLYHGTNTEYDEIDPSKSGGMAFFGEDESVGARYAQNGGGGRARLDDSQKYIVNSNGVVYELEGDSWKAVGIAPEEGLINQATIQPLDKAYPSLSGKEAEKMTNPDSGSAGVVPKSSRIIKKDFSGLNLLDISTPEGRDVIAGLKPKTQTGVALVEAAQFDARDKRDRNSTTQLNSNFWGITKYAAAKGQQLRADIVDPLKAMGYDGIQFQDDQHKSVGLFDTGLKKEKTKAAPAEEATLPDESFGITGGKAPKPEEFIESKRRVDEVVKIVNKMRAKPGSLWSQLTGALNPEEVREIFGPKPNLGQRKLQVIQGGGNGAYVVDLVDDGILDGFLPPNMRHDSNTFDATESAQYIKDAIGNKDYLPFDAKMEVEMIFDSVKEAEDLIKEYLTIEEQNRELQIAADEQREADQEAEITKPQDKDRPASAGEREALELTAPTEDELTAKQDEIDRLTKENERLAKEAERKAKADEEAKDFVLTGSKRDADQAAARGQKDIFAEDNTFNPVELGKEFPEIGAEAFAYLDTTNAEVRKAIGDLYKEGDIDGAIEVLENMPKNTAVVEKQETVAEMKKRLNTLMMQNMKSLDENPALEKEIDELTQKLRDAGKKPKKAKEEPKVEEPEAPEGTVATPDGAVLRYPLAVSMVGEGYKVLALDDPRTYKDKGGEPHRTFEKGPLRIAMTPQRVLFQNRNAVNVAFGNPDQVTLEAIMVDPGSRNQGLATQAMNDVIEAADKNEITLYLEPVPIINIKKNDFGLDRDQLVDFYSKFGFEFQEDSNKVMQRKPGAEVAEEVLPAVEEEVAGQVGFEPYTIEGDFTEVAEEQQRLMLEDQTENLSDAQVSTLEKHYGAKVDSDEFFTKLREDVSNFIVKGATAVNGKIRAIIRQLANGVLAVGIAFNPQYMSQPINVFMPVDNVRTEEVLATVPDAATAKMSEPAKRAFAVIYPALQEQMMAKDKLFIMADKPSGRVFVFNPDGSLLLEKKSLFGLAKGDLYVGDNDKPQNRITPAGLFDLKFVDAAKGAAEKRTAGDYDTGTVLAINDPDGTITIMHSVWLKEKDAAQRAAALRNESPADSRYSFGCINVDAPTYKYMVDNHAKQMDGAALFIVPEAGVDVMSFITGKGAMSEDLARIKIKPVTKEVRTPQKQATQAEAKTKTPGREQQFFSIEGKKLPPGRSPELAAAARLVKEGKMTAAEFDKMVNKYRPITPYEKPLKPATTAQMVDALSSDKKDKVNPDIPEGTRVGLRLDIPAFNRRGVYVVTIHEKGNASGPGKAIGYDSVATINNVTFGTGNQRKGLNIATGEAKDALQTMEGEFVKTDPAQAYVDAVMAMDDPEWTQIGVDPARHSYFYDRNTTQPVIAAEQVIQIGNMVLAKNVTYGRKEDFLYSIEDDLVKLINDNTDSIDEAEKKRSPSFKRKAKVLTNQRNEGKLTDDEYLDRMNAAIAEDEESRLGTTRKNRVRGADFIREKLLNAKRNGFLSEEAVDLAEWFIGQNPDLVDDLGISIKGVGPLGAGGFYNPLARIITLIKERGSDLTTTHEILHHLERMMPAKIQAAIRKAWLTQLMKANKAAKDPAQKLYFMALLDAHIGNNNHTRLEIPKGAESIYEAIVQQMKFANEFAGGRGADPKSSALARELLLYSPTVPSELYEYFDPSEFWAVNGSDIVRARFDAVKGGVLARLKNWLREFAEKVKSLFGMKSDASIIRALDSLAKSDGKFVTDEMLGTGDYQNIKKNALGGEMPEATWAMRESTFGNDWMQRWQDNYRDLKNVQKSITEQIGKIDDRLNAYRKQTVNPGREAERQGDFVKYEVDPLVKEMIANKVSNQELATYLHNRYAEERNEIINAKNKNPAVQNQGSGISTENARKYMEALPADRVQVLEKLAKRIDAIVRGSQDLLVQSGQETQETIDGWRQSSPHYVPLQRDESELDFIVQTGTGSLGGYATAGKFGKEAIGSTKTVKNILENVMLQRDRAIRRAESIRIGQALYGMAIQYPNPDFWMAINPDAVNDIDALIAEMEEMGLDPMLIENILEQPKTGYVKKSTGPEGETLREVRYRVDRAYQNAKNVFPIRINGQNRYVLFNPKSPEALRLAAELKSLNPEQLNLFFGVASSFSRWFAAVNTQYNPVFGLINFWNDTQGALINLSTTPLAGKQSTVLKNVLPAMHGIARDIRKERKQTVKSPIKTAYGEEIDSTDWTNLWRLYRNGGGKTAFRDQMVKPKLNVEWKGMMPSFSYTDAHTMLEALEKIEQGPISKKVEWWADCFSDFNDTLENTVRLAVFKVGYIDMKLPLEEAIDIAKNITVDFNRRGARTKNVRGMYVFFNAALQSNVRIATTLAAPVGKTIVKAGLAMGALNAMWMFLAGFDDDDPPQFTRNKGFVVPTGDGDYFLWNLPQGWRAIPNTGRLVTEGVLISLGLMKSNKGMAGKISDAGGVVFDAINPFGGGTLLQTLAPTFLDPGMALAENKDSFGRPIFKEDQSLKPTPGWQRTRDSASTFSKGLSWLLNYISAGGEEFDKGFLSPTGDQIDYLISQAAGGFARDVKRTGEWAYNTATGEETPSYRKPVLNRFIGETKTDAAASARFYDNVTMLARYENVINGRIENKGDVQGYLKENPLAKYAFVANDFENEVSSINKTIRDLQNMDETPARKQQIKDLKASRIELMKNFNNMVRQAQ